MKKLEGQNVKTARDGHIRSDHYTQSGKANRKGECIDPYFTLAGIKSMQ